MKSVFLISPESKLFDSVYSKTVRARLRHIAALSDEIILNKENIDKYADFAADAEYMIDEFLHFTDDGNTKYEITAQMLQYMA